MINLSAANRSSKVSLPKFLSIIGLTLSLGACHSMSENDSRVMQITQTLRQLNAAENLGPESGIEAKISAIDATMSAG